MHLRVRVVRPVTAGFFLVALAIGGVGMLADAAAACVGDCNGNGAVTVDELVLGVRIALGQDAVEDCTAVDGNEDGVVKVDELVVAVNNALSGCPVDDTPTPTPTSVPTDTPTATATDTPGQGPTETPTTAGEGLGKRLFSFNPETSRFAIEGLPFPVASTSVEGFFELEAGPVDPETGNRPIRLTDASEFIAIWVVPPIGRPSAVCVKPVIDAFPVEDAGELACQGDEREGIIIEQDHNISDIDPECATGTLDENLIHEGVCNGEITWEIIEGDSGPGGMSLAPDPDTLEGGLTMETFAETELPCGDEPDTSQGAVQWALSTGLSRGRVIDADNIEGEMLEFERQGENFSCETWTEEDSAGTLVFVAPAIDAELTGLGRLDLVWTFTFDD